MNPIRQVLWENERLPGLPYSTTILPGEQDVLYLILSIVSVGLSSISFSEVYLRNPYFDLELEQ